MKVLDTTIAVDHLRGVSAATDILEELVGAGETVIASEIVRFELLAGVREPELPNLELFFSVLAWSPIDSRITRRAAALARKYRKSHSGIDNADYLIAATSLELSAPLLTTNVRHFPMLAGLTPAYQLPSL